MKERFLRKDYMVYKPKYFLYCKECKLEFPHFVKAFSAQKDKKQTEK